MYCTPDTTTEHTPTSPGAGRLKVVAAAAAVAIIPMLVVGVASASPQRTTPTADDHRTVDSRHHQVPGLRWHGGPPVKKSPGGIVLRVPPPEEHRPVDRGPEPGLGTVIG